jgi:hypothetical protein
MPSQRGSSPHFPCLVPVGLAVPSLARLFASVLLAVATQAPSAAKAIEPIWLSPDPGLSCPSASELLKAFSGELGASCCRLGEPPNGQLVVRLGVTESAADLRLLRPPATLLLRRRFSVGGNGCSQLARTVALLVESGLSRLPWGDPELSANDSLAGERADDVAVEASPEHGPVRSLRKRPASSTKAPRSDQVSSGPVSGDRARESAAALPPSSSQGATPEPALVPAPSPSALQTLGSGPSASAPRLSTYLLTGMGQEPDGKARAWEAALRVGLALHAPFELALEGAVSSEISQPLGRGVVTAGFQRVSLLGRRTLWEASWAQVAAVLGGGLTRVHGKGQGYLDDGQAAALRATFALGLEVGLALSSRVDLLVSGQASMRTSSDRLVVTNVAPSLTLGAIRLALAGGLRVGVF